MEYVLVLVLLLTLANAQVLVNNPNYCYSLDLLRTKNNDFGLVTPYDQVRGNALDFPPISNCKPARFWFVGRHGSRFPSLADRDEVFSATDDLNKKIVDNFVSLKTTLCPTDAKELNEWVLSPNFTSTTAAPLTETGRVELKEMGKRFRKAFPKLLPTTYNPSHYYFRRSPVSRTLQSAQAFASGLFGDGFTSQVNYDGGSYPDLYLVPYHECLQYNQVLMSPIPEYQAFIESGPYKAMVNQVNKKLGFTGTSKLTTAEINKMFTHCKYEQLNNHKKPSAFCGAFSPANHQVSQYSFDLLFYFATGYGNTQLKFLYENMGCTMVQAMLKFLQSKDPNEHVAKLFFGHDLTLDFVFVALGWFKDDLPLRSSNFAQQTNRKWKTGSMTPMSGNIAVFRYDCPGGDDEVLFLHNERIMQIPGCSIINGMCKLSMILNQYQRFLYANCAGAFCTNTKL